MEYRYNYSVIVPHFTRDSSTELLKRAVASVPEREDIQILVVDNSPVPIPRNLFSERNNVKILYSAHERGAGGARNVGIENSDAKWLLFLDADDFFTAEAFQVFDSKLDAENDIVFFVPMFMYSDDLNKLSNRAETYASLVRDYLKTGDDTDLRSMHVVPWGKMIRMELVAKIGLQFEEVPAANDVMFSLRAGMCAKSIGCDERITYVYTVRKGSISNTHSFSNYESYFYVALRKNQLLAENGYQKISIMGRLVRSIQFGVRPFLKFFVTAIRSGDLLIGYQHWGRNFFRSMASSKRQEKREYEKYKIKE